jgi:hypothetical protein
MEMDVTLPVGSPIFVWWTFGYHKLGKLQFVILRPQPKNLSAVGECT